MRTRSFLLVVGAASVGIWACSGSNSTSSNGNGGSANVGGSSSAADATGGIANVETGGNPGNPGSDATGGDIAVGGSPTTGGAPPTGGNQSTATGGKAATGGALATGGTLATGGLGNTGGSRPTTGSSATGGSAPNGGASATGGTRPIGGRSATGGRSSSGTGGTQTIGGSSTAGGTTGAGGGTCVPDYACTPTAPNTGDIYADCVARINQFRACVCLAPVTQYTAAQTCLDQDAQNDQTKQTAHDGFATSICTPQGNAQNECPGWLGWKSTTQVINQCIQSMFDEGPPPTSTCTGTCYQTYGHYINMTGKFTRAACGFYTVNGQTTAVQDFYP